MPENEPTTAAEIYAEMSQEDAAEVDNDEAKPEPGEESEESEATADEGETEDEDEPEEEGNDEDDLPLTSKLKLDDNLKEKFPEDAKRWDQQVKGLEKVETRLQQNAQGLDVWMTVDNNLANPETAGAQLRELTEFVAKRHGKTVEDLMGVSTRADSDPQSKYGLTHASDDQVVDLLVRKVKEEFGVDPDLMKTLKTEHEAKRQAEAEKTWFEQNGKRIIAKAEKSAGWKVTEKLVLEARRDFPDIFKTDPVLAMKRTDPDAWAESRNKPAEKKPDMFKSSTAKGHVVPTNPHEYSARDAYNDTQA